MARRTQRTERVGGLAADYRIHRGDRRAGGAQARLARARRHHGIRVEAHVPRVRLGAQHSVDVARRVHALQLRAGHLGRLAPFHPDERALALLALQGGCDRAHARDRLRMAGPGVVLERRWMRVEQRGHAAPPGRDRLCSIGARPPLRANRQRRAARGCLVGRCSGRGAGSAGERRQALER
jgi:hypothetical protein